MNRKDGFRVKDEDGLHSLIGYIMPKRCDADVYIHTKIDCTNLVNYMNELKKNEENKDVTYFHMFCTAIGMLIYNRPMLNRFVIEKKLYDRKDISISFVAKKKFDDKAEEVFNVLKLNEDDNLFSLSEKISGNVKDIRENNREHSVDGFINKVGSLPGALKYILMKCVSFADNHDLIPESLTKNSIYHSTVLVSNLGSIGCGAIYHHLTDLGTNSILITIGQIKDEPAVIDGKVKVRKMCEFGVTLDERIGDGFYFAKSLKLLDYIINNPKLMEGDISVRIDTDTTKQD